MINNFYTFEETLGEGSFGKVRRSSKRETGEVVAIKTINKSMLDSDEIVNLELEIEILTQIDHPNIVKNWEIFDEPSKLHVVMELMEGGELFD